MGHQRSSFGRNLAPSMETFGTKSGPDCIALESKQHLQIFTRNGRVRLVRLVDSGERVLLEMSGEVVLKPDLDLADTLEIEVKDPELRAFGTYSRRYVLSFLPVVFIWHVIKWSVSMKFELMSDGESPWWRGLLMLVNGFFFCAGGLWKNCAASLTGETDLNLTHKTFCCLCVALVVMVVAGANVAQLPTTILGGSALFLSGTPLQYFQTRAKYPERRFTSCMLWALANFSSTIGVGVILIVIVVTYRLLLSAGQPVAANLFLPISTALTESLMVSYIRLLYTKLVVDKRPLVPGDISYVALPFMLTAAHGLTEGARVTGVFAGAVTSGEYSWVGSVLLTLFLNVMVRTGWTRLCGFHLLKWTIGFPYAFICAPTAYSKLHDETKIYVGYFRFPCILALISARAIVYQDLSFSGSQAAAYNQSAALALLCMLVTEFLEDYIVVQQIIPMSPIVRDFIDHDLERTSRHTSLLSIEIHKLPSGASKGGWRLDELDESGFKMANKRKIPSSPKDPSSKMSSILPETEGNIRIESASSRLSPSQNHDAKQRVPCAPSEADPQPLEVQNSPDMLGQPSVLTLNPQMVDCEDGTVQIFPSLGRRRDSMPSRLRSWLGQKRVVQHSLLLHGLREMPWDCQLCAIASIAEMTVGFLNTTLGPGYIHGVTSEPCKHFDMSGAFVWPSPLVC
ncbi:Uncharacterized protein SCF082_LOCUS44348 [Durusdinium trenchii]|uniref:Uncharacterized protein n=1 Tax=Durusdinium trenchii TaxID=1381693 RepID=A0ABP0R5E6_9DINO